MKELQGYADADGSMGEDRKAVSGYTFIVNGGAVSWSAKRQELISLLTTESEYVAITHAAKEAFVEAGCWVALAATPSAIGSCGVRLAQPITY